MQLDQRKVLARAEKDPRLQGDEERCRIFRNFVQWSEALSVEGYAGGPERRLPRLSVRHANFLPVAVPRIRRVTRGRAHKSRPTRRTGREWLALVTGSSAHRIDSPSAVFRVVATEGCA